jgi:hypothetical protein
MLELAKLVTSQDVLTLRSMCKDGSDVADILDSLIAAARKAITQDWPAKLWPTINRRRGELINKQYQPDSHLTESEHAELALLQQYADAYLERFDTPRLKALEALLEKFARATGAACDRCGTPLQPGYHRCHECENKHGYHPAETGTR